ncbi:MAG TPA: MFS transporter [Xanthobacteraceae bacterium]|nr:MFS transporter [Xanthobacteraceae bacterium]
MCRKDGDASLSRPRLVVVAALGTSQTLAWASSYYLPAVLARPISAAIAVPSSWVFAAFSAALLIAAIAGPMVGRMIDRHGGRGVLVLSNVVLACGLAALACVTGPVSLFGAWAILGIGMALGLYDAGFATLTALYGAGARGPITGITLLAGFASTLSWPLSSFLDHAAGWRGACLVWAALNLLVGLPVNRFLLPQPARAAHRSHAARASVGWKPRREMLLLAFVFAAAWFVTGSMAAHLPSLLELAGATPFAAIAAAALVGPAQVAARIFEFVILRRIHPLVSARLAATLHPIGAAALSLMGAAGAVPFAALYGAGNGLLTIARGTVPLAIFGPHAYGERTGLIGAPARAAQALAPLTFGLLLDAMGLGAVAISASLCLAALAALLFLRASAAVRFRSSEQPD